MSQDLADRRHDQAQDSRSSDAYLHRIVVVGGGAGGLELVTRLGNKLGQAPQGATSP